MDTSFKVQVDSDSVFCGRSFVLRRTIDSVNSGNEGDTVYHVTGDINVDAYLRASYISKLKRTGTIMLTDLDGTFASGELHPSEKETCDRKCVREFLEHNGYVAGAVTARTPALTMSHDLYHASREHGFQEAPPLRGFVDGVRCYTPLQTIPFFEHSLDWDVVAGFGSGTFPRNGKGYLIDREYDDLLNYDHQRRKDPVIDERIPWRMAALTFLAMHYPGIKDHFASIESHQNYLDRKTDVPPLKYRIQLEFKGESGLQEMRKFRKMLRDHRDGDPADPLALRMAVVDESKPSERIEDAKYTLYLVPWGARKEKMINHLVSKSVAAAGLDPKEVRLFYAGDTPTDLRAGLYAGGNAQLVFLLASGSRLAPHLINRSPNFGEESLSFLWESQRRTRSRFNKTNRKGVYSFDAMRVGKRKNLVVIADERYPGTTPPGSIAEFLEEFATTPAS